MKGGLRNIGPAALDCHDRQTMKVDHVSSPKLIPFENVATHDDDPAAVGGLNVLK